MNDVRAVTGQPAGPPGLDPFGWFIATSHQLLGHDKTAIVLGMPAGDKQACVICAYERQPTPARKAAVQRALYPQEASRDPA